MCLQGARAQRTARVQRSRQRCGACSHPPAHTAGIALLASMHTLASAALHTPASAALQDPPSGNPPFPLRGLQWYDFPTPSLWQEAERRKPESSGPPKGGSGAAGLRSAVGAQCPGLQVPLSPSPESGSELGFEFYRQAVGGKEAVGRAGRPVLMGWTEKLGQLEWPWPGPGGRPAAGEDAHSSGGHSRGNLPEYDVCGCSPAQP